MDFHETCLRAVLGFTGITNVKFVHTEGLALGPDAAAKAIALLSRSHRRQILIPAALPALIAEAGDA